MSEDRETCVGCVYYEPHSWGTDGKCRRFPPNANGWPEVASDDWCGEFDDGEVVVFKSEAN